MVLPLHPEQRTLVSVSVSLPRSGRWPGSPPAASTTAGSESPGAGENREATTPPEKPAARGS